MQPEKLKTPSKCQLAKKLCMVSHCKAGLRPGTLGLRTSLASDSPSSSFLGGRGVAFRAIPAAYGGSQARGPIRAVATGLCHSHSNARSEPHLRPTPRLIAQIFNPLGEARDLTSVFMDTSQIPFC